MNRPLVSDGFLTGLKWWPVIFLFALCCSALGASPVARIGSNIDEQSIIEPGDPLEFEADSLTEKERCKWKVIPAFSQTGKPTFKLSGDKRVLTVFSRTGTYAITLYVWNEEDMAETVRVITVGKPTTLVGPAPVPVPVPKVDQPPPKPDPVPVPDPLPVPLGFDKIIANAVRLNVPASERSVAANLAENYRVGATNIANGTWPIDKAIKNQLALNTATPGYKADVWRPVFKDVADRLAEARDSGQFTTQKQYVAIWAELSFAFAEVAK